MEKRKVYKIIRNNEIETEVERYEYEQINNASYLEKKCIKQKNIYQEKRNLAKQSIFHAHEESWNRVIRLLS